MAITTHTGSVTRRTHWAVYDGLVVVFCTLAGLWISAQLMGIPLIDKLTPVKFFLFVAGHLSGLIATSAAYLKVFRGWRSYRSDLRRIFQGLLISGLALMILFWSVKPLPIAAADTATVALLAFICLAAVRRAEYQVKKSNREAVVFLAGLHEHWTPCLEEIRAKLAEEWRLAVIEFDDMPKPEALPNEVECWDPSAALAFLDSDAGHAARCLFVLDEEVPRSEELEELLRRAYGGPIPIASMIDFYEEILEKSPMFALDGRWICPVGLPRADVGKLFAKRALDLVVSAILCVPAIVVILVCGLIVRLESPGPAIFTQPRTGRGAKAFTIYKLRTMTQHQDDSLQWPKFEAHRVTRFGHVLRKTGLDELPQIFNVLMGQMSLIGPRPARPLVTQRHEIRLPFYAVTYSVKPGITGWAQLHQGQDADDGTVFEKTRYNLYYAKYFSFWLDILIIIRTFSQLMMGRKEPSIYLARGMDREEGQGLVPHTSDWADRGADSARDAG